MAVDNTELLKALKKERPKEPTDAEIAKSGSVARFGGPMRGTFTTLTSGVTLLFK